MKYKILSATGAALLFLLSSANAQIGAPGYTTGGTGVTVTSSNFPLNHDYYVDGGRAAIYTANGSLLYPYRTVKAAIDAINTDATAHAAAGHYELSNYIVHVAAGTYSDNLTFNNQKYIRLEGEVIGV